jgi:hypothetical protein
MDINGSIWTNQYFRLNFYNSIEYYIPVGQETKITHFHIEVMNKLKWYPLTSIKKTFNIWCVTLPIDKLKWSKSFCNCLAFFLKFMCKHLVGIVLRSG